MVAVVMLRSVRVVAWMCIAIAMIAITVAISIVTISVQMAITVDRHCLRSFFFCDISHLIVGILITGKRLITCCADIHQTCDISFFIICDVCCSITFRSVRILQLVVAVITVADDLALTVSYPCEVIM